MLDICLLGTAGMMPQPHRWLTAMMARFNGSSLLIDCGEGTQIAMKEAGSAQIRSIPSALPIITRTISVACLDCFCPWATQTARNR